MKKIDTFFALLLMLLTFHASAQELPRACGSADLFQQQYENNPEFRRNVEEIERHTRRFIQEHPEGLNGRAVVTIPVVFHVIHDGDVVGSGENISDAYLLAQLDQLNLDFRRINADITNVPSAFSGFAADMEIQFCLASRDPSGNATTGINRYNYGAASYDRTYINGTIKPATIWDRNSYLNIWSVVFGGADAGLLGYAQFPGGTANTDGVVLKYSSIASVAYPFPTGAPYNKGRTATHEVGHWINLRHIWGDESACAADDLVSDTPLQGPSNSGCPAFPVTDACTATSPGVMYMNYMDYTTDACTIMFTSGQKTRAQAIFASGGSRVSLLSSLGCSPVNPQINFQTAATSVTEGTASCPDAGQTVTLTLNIAAAPSQNAVVTFNTTGSTASATDFSISPATVTFNAGSTASKTVTVTIKRDAIAESSETVKIDFTVNPNGGNAQAGTLRPLHTITITDDDITATPQYTTKIINADFDSGTNGFTTTTSGTSSFALGTVATGSSTYWQIGANNTTQFMYINDDVCNCTLNDARLISPVFSLAGATDATLNFKHAFSDLDAEVGEVLISTNGGTSYATLYNITNTSAPVGTGGIYNSPWKTETGISLAAYVGQTNLRLAFKYNDGGAWEYGMAVDDVVVNKTQPRNIQTAVNTTLGYAEYEVGPNQTVDFFDQTTGNIMATIVNTSSYDYGCTKVEVTRAGTSSAQAWAANTTKYIASKTYKITPTNNAGGSYNVSLYYTEAEIAGWEAATGRARTEAVILKTSGDITQSPPPTAGTIGALTLSAFNTDHKLTASFSGFSSFGVGTSGSLPIEWLSFKATPNKTNITLDWSTTTETNNKGFEVQRTTKINGVFETLAFVPSRYTNSTTTTTYTFTDDKVQAGITYYYRIKQVDLDGQSSLSEIVAATIKTERLVSPVTPNPATANLQLTATAPITIHIVDISGRVLHSQQGTIGENTISLDNLPTGVYFLQAISGSTAETQRFVKIDQK